MLRSACCAIVLLLCVAAACGAAGSALAADVWRIAALRVEFQRELPDDPTTTGNGGFDLRSWSEARSTYCYPFDTPPHDRRYVERHLEALANYYRDVSDGAVEVRFDVYPRTPGSAYLLPRRMVEYGNGRSQDEIDQKLVELFRDAVQAADSAEGAGLDLSAFRSLVIVHAGYPYESGLALNDIRSAFLTSRDLGRLPGGGVGLRGRDAVIREGWIIPEAVTTNGTGGLNGTIARFFGNQLGLPGLSDFKEGLPALGGWSLMDAGASLPGPELAVARAVGAEGCSFSKGSRFVGFAPPHPEAWSKVALGWVQPVTVTRDTTIDVLATDVPLFPLSPDRTVRPPKVVRVPINDHECLLIENRQARGAPDRWPGVTLSDDSVGVWLSIREGYDAFVPGSGILIWHVDQAVIDAGRDDNSINNDHLHRGIDLEEADGCEDIGNPSYNRRQEKQGYEWDPFFVGTAADPFFVGGTTSFGPVRGYDGHDSGVSVEVLSAPADVMSLRITFRKNRPGWPVTGLPFFGADAPRAADLDGDGDLEVIAASADGRLNVFNPDGTSFVSAATGDSVNYTPLVLDVNGDGLVEVVASGHGAIRALNPRDSLKPLWTASFPEGLSAAPIGLDPDGRGIQILGAVADGSLIRLDGASGAALGRPSAPGVLVALSAGRLGGNASYPTSIGITGSFQVLRGADSEHVQWGPSGSPTGPAVIGDLDGDGKTDIVTLSTEGNLAILGGAGAAGIARTVGAGQSSPPVPVTPIAFDLGFTPDGPPALADIDADGRLEVVATGNGTVGAVRFNGVQSIPQPGFPVRLLPERSSPERLTSPVLADLDGDERPEILFGSSAGLIHGLNSTGGVAPGFPLVALGSIDSPPAVADLDLDGRLEIIALTSNGAVHVWNASGISGHNTGGAVYWGTQGGSVAGTSEYAGPRGVPGTPSGPLLSRAYCYPNPVDGGAGAYLRFFLRVPASVRLHVLDLAGDEVFARDFGGFPGGTDSEVLLPGGLPSGLHICRLEASADGESGRAFVKVAVRR